MVLMKLVGRCLKVSNSLNLAVCSYFPILNLWELNVPMNLSVECYLT